MHVDIMDIMTVMRAKKLQVPGSKRWKILISDGEKTMLGVCSNDVSNLFENKSMSTGTIFKLKQFSTATMSNARTIYVVHEIEIVHRRTTRGNARRMCVCRDGAGF